MIEFYFHTTPNSYKIALMLGETGLRYNPRPIDTRKGEQHTEAFLKINPNGKVPAIIDNDGPDGQQMRVFDSSAILLYLAEKTGKFMGKPSQRGELLSWLLFVGTGVGPFSGQAVHFDFYAPEKIPYALNRYRKEMERQYHVLDDTLKTRPYIAGTDYTIVDMSAWAWLDRAGRVLGRDHPFVDYPHLERWFNDVEGRPAVKQARMLGENYTFKQEMDEQAFRALYPQNYT